MDEEKMALEFYKEIVQALRSSGTRQIIVTLTPDGKLEANVVQMKNPCANKGKLEETDALK